jgi:uncharacterized surface protein with fasciclin (FAS1) repeats
MARIVLALVFAASASAFAPQQQLSAIRTRVVREANIVETAVGAGSFKTLVAAVSAAGLAPTLSGPGPFTVFAPTDAAFAKLPAGTVEALLKDIPKLKGILTYHVVAGKVPASTVVTMNGKTAKTVNGAEVSISVSAGGVKVDGATVVTTDIMCDNGIIHVIDAVILPKAPVAKINGWAPDAAKPCFGLPGAIGPLGYFDPAGFCGAGVALKDVKRIREAEVMHSRVAMMAIVGYLIGESTPTPFGITGIANDQLQQTPLPLFAALTMFIAISEAFRATKGWVEPGPESLWTLRENYYPGDLGFDPLGLKPTSAADFATRQAQELSNGRLAMLAVAGACAQEIVNGKGLLENLGF